MATFQQNIYIGRLLDEERLKIFIPEDDQASQENASMKKCSKPTMFHIETVNDAPKRNIIVFHNLH
jgi:hypothetical protein